MKAMRVKLAAAAMVFAGGLGAVFFPLANAQPPGVGGLTGSGAAPRPGGGPPGGSGVGGPPRVDPAFVPPAMASSVRTKWEYKFVIEDRKALYEKLFADLGNDGWEFCGTPNPDGMLVFKREKVAAPRAFSGMGAGSGMFGGSAAAPNPTPPNPAVPPPMGAPTTTIVPDGGRVLMGGTPNVPPAVGGTVAAPVSTSLTIIPIRNTTAVEVAAVLEKVFRSNMTVTAEPRTNTVIISANEKTLAEVKALIEKIDVDVPAPPRPTKP